MENRVNRIFFVLMLVVCSCSNSPTLEPDELKSWVMNPDNGLLKEKEIYPFRISLLYKPTSFVVLHELKIAPEAKEFQQLVKEQSAYYHFTLRIDSKDRKEEFLKTGIKDNGEYYERLQYFTGLIQKDVSIITDNDTLPCVFAHLERLYHMASYGDLHLVFPVSKKDNKNSTDMVGSLSFIYEDYILGVGPLKFTYDTETINQIPQIKI